MSMKEKNKSAENVKSEKSTNEGKEKSTNKGKEKNMNAEKEKNTRRNIIITTTMMVMKEQKPLMRPLLFWLKKRRTLWNLNLPTRNIISKKFHLWDRERSRWTLILDRSVQTTLIFQEGAMCGRHRTPRKKTTSAALSFDEK